eukprot:CAMPEP_0183294062 /NCGR_PEP_ID=MMETSP0160_2-20130417/2527_1 /TAXON_ID=2839 ORGANISM="Odontella Sinensis, Strain Grunow 1884" /NCGR_SAMPLE_ID=MMETSP0160_2 /ASSEMBLY_ACC=CAM_ASM_000250 /LENGTH=319 /DNA_ID=CAMNT_0025455293 /DNA_START=36 /DNA_END=995 /DNA_ORIENTATION=+
MAKKDRRRKETPDATRESPGEGTETVYDDPPRNGPPDDDDRGGASERDDADRRDVKTKSEEAEQSDPGEGNEVEEPKDSKNEEKKEKKKKKVRRLSLTEAEDFGAKLRRRGVVYVSRIPPRMGPAKMKTLMSEFGVVTRVYLEEEDKAARKRRKRLSGGGGGGKRYTEGWVEFEDKKIAKRVGESLNNTPISGQKRSVHYGDLWNVKYLRKFKWEHLTERVAYERRVREQKVRIEMMQARRENAEYASLVEEGKTMDRIEERRRKRQAKEDPKAARNGEAMKKQKLDAGERPKRSFRQTAPVAEKDIAAAKQAVLGSLV